MGMGLIAAAAMESVAFGVNSGLDPRLIADSIGGEAGFRALVRKYAGMAAEGRAGGQGIKHGQLPYFLEEAEARGYALPITEALWKFLENEPREIQEANRKSPSFWKKVTRRT